MVWSSSKYNAPRKCLCCPEVKDLYKQLMVRTTIICISRWIVAMCMLVWRDCIDLENQLKLRQFFKVRKIIEAILLISSTQSFFGCSQANVLFDRLPEVSSILHLSWCLCISNVTHILLRLQALVLLLGFLSFCYSFLSRIGLLCCRC